jgi:hypothetical protein
MSQGAAFSVGRPIVTVKTPQELAKTRHSSSFLPVFGRFLTVTHSQMEPMSYLGTKISIVLFFACSIAIACYD